MAYSILTNTALANGSLHMWAFINLLLGNGWTKTKDSDASTYSNTGAQVTNGGAGANGLGNASAYVVLREAVSGRQFCIQNTFNSGEYWRLKYSAQSGFATDSGTPITVVPSAADEVVIFGGNTDASPGTVQFMPDNGTYYMQSGANSSAPRNFYLACYDKITGTTRTLFYLDIMSAGTYPNTDADPSVIFCTFGSGCGLVSTIANEIIGPTCWFRYGLGGSGYVVTPPIVGTNSSGLTIIPGGVGTNALTNEDNIFPFFYIRRGALSSPTGYKGVSSLVLWKGSNRVVGDSGNGNSKFVFGDILLPYDSATTPAL